MEHSAGLSKITRPRLYRSLARERLFGQLDAMCARQAIWITGPPGIGKTTLCTSYLERRRTPALWYQMDSGDADPASFFYYLGVATQALAGGDALPLLTPEYLADLPGFTRRYVRQLFGRLRKGTVLVFDNYHAVSPASVLHAVIRDAIEEIPETVCVIFTSRAEPPPQLTRLRLSSALGCLGGEALRMELDEAHALAAVDGTSAISDADIHEAWTRSGGWTAGFVLMLAHRRATGREHLAGMPASRDILFDYFAVEILGATSPEVCHILSRTAFLPMFTVPMAEAISGNLDAGEQLDTLYRLGYFIDRRGEPEPTYEYNGLFREFLLARARAQLDPAECVMLQRRAARLLEIGNHPEQAFDLYVQSEDWPAAVRLIRDETPGLIRQGRWQTAQGWIALLPPALLAADPWLWYWAGACAVPVDPARARTALEQAYAGLAAQGDARGQVMAAALVMETYYFEWTTFAPLDHWIAVLSGLLEQDVSYLSAAAELGARAGLVASLLYRQPQHPLLLPESARALALLEADVPLGVRFTAGIILLNCYCFRGDFSNAERVVGLLAPHLAHRALTPLNQVWWHMAFGYYQLLLADHAAAAGALDRADNIAQAYGLAFLQPALQTQRALVALTFGDLDHVTSLLPRIKTAINPSRRMDLALFQSAQSWYAFQRGDLATATQQGQAAVDAAFEAGAVTIQTYCLLGRAIQQLEAGEPDTVHHAAASVQNLRLRAEHASLLLDFSCLLIEAWAAFQAGDITIGQDRLRAALAIGRAQNFVNTLRWYPKMIVRLLCHALEANIEVDYVRHLIRTRRLAPDTPEIEQWPWPVKLYLLGRFSVVIDDVPLKTSGKAQAKPLELLKALVAGGGREVAAATLGTQLWPDLDGDAAQNALDTTLHRLRKLLRVEDAILVQLSKLSLNPAKVWVDVWAFERLANRCEQAGTPCTDAATSAKFFRLYVGNILPQETDAPWLLPIRERLRSKFLRQVLKLGCDDEALGDWAHAADTYRHGLEVDNLSEELYRRLMQCELRRNQAAAALDAYRRCRQMLSIVLGVKPSAATEAVHRAILGQD
jgi:LuxR family maltose regulon positive regulatory protein